MSVYFTSDLHISHRLAAEKRGFFSVQEHDEEVINSIASQLHKRDLLWILGDVCMDQNKLWMLNEIPGTKKLIIGNHDQENTQIYLKYFKFVHGFVKYKNMWLSHCPIHPQELYGKICVHGHVHSRTNSPILPFPYINVNWDFTRGVVSLDEIRDFIDSGNEFPDWCL